MAFQAYKENDLAIQVQAVEDFLKNAKLILKPYDKEGEKKEGKNEFFILGDNDDIISKTDDMFLITSNMS